MGSQSDFTSPDVSDPFSPGGTEVDLATEVAGVLPESKIDVALQRTAEKGASSGYASLDAGGKLPTEELTNHATVHQSGGSDEVDHDALTGFEIGEHRVINDAGTSTIEMWSASKIDSEVSAVAAGLDIKNSVATVAIANIALSGEQTINGFLTSGSRVGVVGQTLAEDNGIYVSAAGAWTRSTDTDGTPSNEVTQGMAFFVGNTSSTKNGFQYILTTADPITVGTTPLSFTEVKRVEFGTAGGTATEGNDGRVPTQDENDALLGTNGTPSTTNRFVTNTDPRNTDIRTPVQADESTVGGGEVATQSETDTGSDDTRIVTPLKLATTTQVKKHTFVFSTTAGVPATGTRFLDREGIAVTSAPVLLVAAAVLRGITIAADSAPGATREYEARVVSDPGGTDTLIGSALTLTSAAASASRRDLTGVIGPGVRWGVVLVRTAGSGASSFVDVRVELEIQMP